jgi:hypothetical protein
MINNCGLRNISMDRPMTTQIATALFVVSLLPVNSPADEKPPWEAEPFAASPSEIIKAAERLKSPADAHVDGLYQSLSWQFDSDGRCTIRLHQVRRLLSDAAVTQLAVVSAGWSPWYENRPEIKARVITSDGTEHLLESDNIAEAPARSGQANVYTDRRQLQAPLPAVETGVVVETLVTSTQHRPFSAIGSFYIHSYAQGFQWRKMRSHIVCPESLPMRFRVEGGNFPVTDMTKEGQRQILVQVESVQATEDFEYLMPSELLAGPRLIFSTAKSWKEVAHHYHSVVEQKIGSTAVAPLVRQTLKTLKDDASREQTILTLLKQLQRQVRYTGILFGEGAIIPHSPDETLRRRYGDCKDQAILLVAMLREAGIPAYVALLNANSEKDASEDMPGLSAFNHAIVFVPGESPLWIDPTAAWLRPGQLPAGDQACLALVAGPETTKPVRTPVMSSATNLKRVTRRIAMREIGDVEVESVTTTDGLLARELRATQASLTPAEWRQHMTRFYVNSLGADSVESVETDATDLSKPFELSVRFNQPNFAVVAKSDAIVVLDGEAVLNKVSPVLFGKSVLEGDEPASRKYPLHLKSSVRSEMAYHITPPRGFSFREIPASFSKSFGPVRLQQKCQEDADGTIEVKFVFDTGDGRLSAQDVNRLRAEVSKLRSSHGGTWKPVIKFDHSAEKLMAEGETAKAMAEFKRMEATQADNGMFYSRFAAALRSAGFRHAAEDYARRAVKLAPEQSDAWADLGLVLLNGRLGEQFESGCDLKGAREALQKALALDSTNFNARWNLAVTYEYSDDGRRYSSDADLKSAIRELRQIAKERPDFETTYRNLTVDLGRAEQYADVQKLFQQQQSPAWMVPYYLSATAVKDGAKAAALEAKRLTLDDASANRQLRFATDVLNNLRQYATAAALIDEQKAPVLSPQLKALKQTFLKLKWNEDSVPPKGDPTRLAYQAAVAMLKGGYDRNAAATLYAVPDRNSDAGKSPVNWRDVRQLMDLSARIDAAVSGPRGGSSDRIADSVSLWTWNVDGDKDTGFRIKADSSLFGKTIWYVTPDSMGQRLFDPGVEGAEIGHLAMDLLKDGKTAIAAKWLAWVVEPRMSEVGWFNLMSGPAFARVYRLSKKDDPKDLTLVAAMLAANSYRDSKRARDVLPDVRDEQPPVRQVQIDRALIRNAWASGKPELGLDGVDRLLKKMPLSDECRRKSSICCSH